MSQPDVNWEQPDVKMGDESVVRPAGEVLLASDPNLDAEGSDRVLSGR